MLEIIRTILMDVLVALYEPFCFSVVLGVLLMFLYMFAQEHGWNVLVQRWYTMFKNEKSFRRLFVLAFYAAMILCRTLLNRRMWTNPFHNIIGVWGIYNQNGELTTETIENLMLFIPFTILLLWTFHGKLLGKKTKFIKVLGKSTCLVFLISLTIEFLQLFLHLGTFQLSDLFYNTLGGFLGGLIYWIGYKINSRKRKGEEE